MLGGIIRFVLRCVPRSLLQRMATYAVPIMGLFYIGRGKQCPICGVKRRKFLPYGYVTSRKNALCPNCLSLERHRLLWLYLERETTILSAYPKILHIAHELCIMRRLKSLYKSLPERYITADLESPLADMHFDVQSIPLEDGFADVIICNHILEHIADDRLAMRELYRVLKNRGWGILLSPVEIDRAETFEDDSITDPEERTRVFGQYDHRRIYGRDYSSRLSEAGFKVQQIDYYASLPQEICEKYALSDEIIYLVSKE